MLEWIFRPLGAGRPADDAELDEREIIDYPPPARGLPCVGIDRLLSAQSELLKELRQSLPLSERDFDMLILPTVRNVAAFVHLLPASENHHHAKAGGLLRHSLEVAHWAALFSNPTTFEPFGDPLVRRKREPRWHAAAGLAGLLHDVGKPVTDLDVIARDGSQQWNKAVPLLDWLQKHSIERYVIAWHTGRHRAHENHAAGLARILLPDLTVGWMLEGGSDIYNGLISALSRGAVDNRLADLWKQADQTSVERDMKRSGVLQRDAGSGISLHTYLLEAIQQLIRDERWRVNESGSPVWHLHDQEGEVGLFIVWRKQTVQQVVEVLRERRVPGVSDDLQRLAQCLIDRGAAATYEDHIYWPISPACLSLKQGKRTFLHAIRISDPALIFDSKTPSTMQAVIGREEPAVEQVAEVPPAAETPRIITPAPPPADTEAPVQVALTVAQAEDSSALKQGKPSAPEAKVPKEPPQQASIKKSSPREQLQDAGNAGQALLRLADLVNEGKLAPIFVPTKKGMLLQLGKDTEPHVDTDELRKELANTRFVQVDPLEPHRLIREVNGRAGILLINAIGRPLRSILKPKEAVADATPQNRENAAVQKSSAPGREDAKDDGARILAWLLANPSVTDVSAAVSGLSRDLGISSLIAIRALKDHASIRMEEGRLEIMERTVA